MLKQTEPFHPRSRVPNDDHISAAIPAYLKRKVVSTAKAENTYISEIVRVALENYFAQSSTDRGNSTRKESI